MLRSVAARAIRHKSQFDGVVSNSRTIARTRNTPAISKSLGDCSLSSDRNANNDRLFTSPDFVFDPSTLISTGIARDVQFCTIRPIHNIQPIHPHSSPLLSKRSVRFYSTGPPKSTKSPKNDNGDKATRSSKESTETTQQQPAQLKHPITLQSLSSEEAAKLKEGLASMVNSVGPRIQRMSGDWNTGDLISVYGIITLISLIIVSPIVVRQMRRSDSTYEDLNPEDPVADLAKLVKEEFQNHADTNPELVGALGGMDSLVADLLQSKPIQEAVTVLVTQVLGSQEFKKACQVLLKELWKDLVEDPDTLAQVVHLLQHAIADEKIKIAATKLVMDIVEDPEILEELKLLLQRLGMEKEVLEATQSLLVESAHNALNDPDILDHSMEFATDVVGDDVVQRTAGEALYNTLSYAVRPTLSVALAFVGGSLILVSVVAFRYAHSSDTNMDRAVSISLEVVNASSSALNRLSKVLFFPVDMLSKCKDLLVDAIFFPIRFARGTASQVNHMGHTAWDKVVDGAWWILCLPGNMVQSALKSLQGTLHAATRSTSGRLHSLAAHVTDSTICVYIFKAVDSVYDLVAIVGRGWNQCAERTHIFTGQTRTFTARSSIMLSELKNASMFQAVESVVVLGLYKEELWDLIQRCAQRLIYGKKSAVGRC